MTASSLPTAVGGLRTPRPCLSTVAACDLEDVEWMMERGVDSGAMVDDDDDDDFHAMCPTPLHQACFDGRLDLVQLMLETQTAADGFDLDPANCQGQTPLLLAVQSGNTDLVSYLIEVGSNAHHSDLNGNNALHLAAAASVRWFVHHHVGGVDQSLQMSSAAARSEQREMVDLLVSYGVSMRQRNRHGLTPVRLAALLGSDECARRMLKRIFVKSGLSRSQETAVHEETDESTRDTDQHDEQTPSSSDVDHRLRLVKSLHRLIARRGAGTSGGPTATLRHGRRRHSRRVRSFIDDPSSLLGVTPLYAACTSGDHEAARLLLDVCQADPDCGGCSSTPSYGAAPCRGRRLVGLPLGVAILRNDVALVRLLLDRGASACCRCLEESSNRRASSSHAVTTDDERLSGGQLTTDRSGRDGSGGDDDDDECDLLELALYTDWPVSRLLIAGGACVTPGVEHFLSAAIRSAGSDASASSATAVAETVAAIYEANGNRNSVWRMLFGVKGAATSAFGSPPPAAVEGMMAALCLGGSEVSCDSLLQLSRLTVRRLLAPRVFWAVGHLQLPEILKRFIALE